ncbi:uncharacterized protein LOC143013584 isoform X1 [Genypterus blacodes]|uniref:uncharacterized protein LOC143013584 isoform X1 n=1 Tax=Genypterus blacodes TaxID=154954 RepID=UPI003F762907
MTKLCMSLCLLSALSVVVMMLQTERGHVGQDLTFTCSNWNNGMNVTSHVKYFCRGPCHNRDVIVKAEPGETKEKNRISITNTGQSLSVTFTKLEMKDAKTYMCGLKRYFKDSLIEVELEVIDAVTPTPKTTPKSTTVGSMTSVSGSIKTLSDSDNMTHTFTPRTNSSVQTPTASGARGGGGRGGGAAVTPTTKRTPKSTTVGSAKPTASGAAGGGGAGISPFSIVGLIVMVVILMVHLTLMKYLKRKSHMDAPGEEAGQSGDSDGADETLPSFTEDQDPDYSTVTFTVRMADLQSTLQSVKMLNTEAVYMVSYQAGCCSTNAQTRTHARTHTANQELVNMNKHVDSY